MTVLDEYQDARRDEDSARIRRVLALRALSKLGMSQREIAHSLGISQPAVSQQLKNGPDLRNLHPEQLLAEATPILKALAKQFGYKRLSVFGSVARRDARMDSDIDLLVEPPPKTSTFDFLRFRQLLEDVLDHDVDLVDFRGLKPGIDDDIRRHAIRL